MTNEQTQTILNVAKLVVISYVGFYAIKAIKNISGGVDSATSAAADLYVETTNPIVHAQIGINSNYFGFDGRLTNAAREVFAEYYPNMYAKIFINDKLRSEYQFMLDNDIKYKDVDFV